MHKENKTLCFIIHSLSPGGKERVMSELVNYLSKKPNLDLHLVLFGHKRELFFSISEKVEIHLPVFEFKSQFRFLSTIKTLIYLRKRVRKIQPNSILSFGEYWNNFVLIALWGLKVPIFISDRSSPTKKLSRIHTFLRKKLYPKAAGFIAQTMQSAEITLNDKRNGNIRVIGNPIRAIKNVQEHERENIILTVGRLIKTKNLDQLIRIFAKINLHNWKLVIVGGESQREQLLVELINLSRKMGVSDRVDFVGFQTDVDDYYRRSKIFAFTSSSEGFPNVVGEALSAGLPVVAFDSVAGNSDLVKNGRNGFLVGLFDYSEMEKKIRLLMENEEIRIKMSKYKSDSIHSFSIDSISEKYLQFII